MRGADTILTETMLGELRAIFGARLRPDEPLSRHGTFGVGGPADAWVPVTREEELVALVNLASDARLAADARRQRHQRALQ